MTATHADAMKIALGEEPHRRQRDRAQGRFDRRGAHAPAPPAREDTGRKRRVSDKSGMKGGESSEGSLGGFRAASERAADGVNRLAQGDRLRQKVRGQIGAPQDLFRQPVGVLRRQRLAC